MMEKKCTLREVMKLSFPQSAKNFFQRLNT